MVRMYYLTAEGGKEEVENDGTQKMTVYVGTEAGPYAGGGYGGLWVTPL